MRIRAVKSHFGVCGGVLGVWNEPKTRTLHTVRVVREFLFPFKLAELESLWRQLLESETCPNYSPASICARCRRSE